MKTYVGRNEHKDEYIRKVRTVTGNDKFLKVTYASGGGLLGAINGMRTYKIPANEERIENINHYMENEAEIGKGKYDSYKKIGTISAVVSAISATAPIAFDSIVSLVGTQANLEEATKAVVIVGATTALATGITSISNLRKAAEMKKINYRDENQVILDQVKNYESSLECISNRKKRLIQKRKNPFGVIWSEDYSLRDLKKIVARIKQAMILGLVSQDKKDFPIPREEFQVLSQPQQAPTPIAPASSYPYAPVAPQVQPQGAFAPQGNFQNGIPVQQQIPTAQPSTTTSVGNDVYSGNFNFESFSSPNNEDQSGQGQATQGGIQFTKK